MIKEHFFRIADFIFSVKVPKTQDIVVLLPSLIPFRCEKTEAEPILFRFEAFSDELPCETEEKVIGESVNDLGFTRLKKCVYGYKVELKFTIEGAIHTMIADSRFKECKAVMCWEDAYVGSALCSLLRIAFAQAVVWHNAISIHASVVKYRGVGYLFMGKSGTGKSTHSSIWQQNFDECTLLNDDNPTIRIVDGKPMVYGTAWSGKTPCYKNEGCPLGGMVRLYQASENSFTALSGVEAFMAVLPGCSVIRQDVEQYNTLCATLTEFIQCTKVGRLDCLPNAEAAQVCYAGLMQE